MDMLNACASPLQIVSYPLYKKKYISSPFLAYTVGLKLCEEHFILFQWWQNSGHKENKEEGIHTVQIHT